MTLAQSQPNSLRVLAHIEEDDVPESERPTLPSISIPPPREEPPVFPAPNHEISKQAALSNTRLHVVSSRFAASSSSSVVVADDPPPDTERMMRPRYESGPRLRRIAKPARFASFATPDRAFFTACVDGWEEKRGHVRIDDEDDERKTLDDPRRDGLARWAVMAIVVCTAITVAAFVGHLGIL